jgi:hypothetical protein
MATVRPHDERRRFSRISFQRPATFSAGGARTMVAVLDVSLKGALLEVSATLAAEPGSRCALAINLDAGDSVIHLDGEVAHHHGNRLGIRCTSIDLESIGHLRRVVELNLADEDLLERELATLIAGEGLPTSRP